MQPAQKGQLEISYSQTANCCTNNILFRKRYSENWLLGNSSLFKICFIRTIFIKMWLLQQITKFAK